MEKQNKYKGHLKDVVDFSLTFSLKNTPLSLLDTVKNVGFDFRLCFRHRKLEKSYIGRHTEMT